MVARSTDGALLNLMVSHEQLNRPLKWTSDLEAKIQALTAEQVSAAFRKHVDPKSGFDREGRRLQGGRRLQVRRRSEV